MMSWTVPFVTGHKYKISWGNANDFDSMSIQTSAYQKPDDKDIYLVSNFTD